MDWTALFLTIHFLLALVISLRVVMRRAAVGVALAWLLVVAILPFVGVVAYLLIGEKRLSPRRAARIRELRPMYEAAAQEAIRDTCTDVDWSSHPPPAQGMDRLGTALIGLPTVRGNNGTLYSDTQDTLARIIQDIDGAERSLLMEFYIWAEGGKADEVLEAVIRAAERGVVCRVLIDAVGGRPWWRGRQPARLRQAGVHVRPALPVSLLRTLVRRADLRLHRKILVVDGDVAWTGSMNLVDPRFFKQDADVGEWVDAMVRVEGSVVAALGATMLGDWVLETGEALDEVVESACLRRAEPVGDGDAQVVPSGPEETDDGLLQMLLVLINAAREELTLTTPYFVPDESLLLAIRGAAARGVRVRLILPERVDSRMTRYASRSYYDELLSAGVEIHLFQGGLLHTKSVLADRGMCMFGTVNLDMRSLWLNYEVALFVYGETFGTALAELHQEYLANSRKLDPAAWSQRSPMHRFVENLFRLTSPLL